MFYYNLFVILVHHPKSCKIQTLTGLFDLVSLLLVRLINRRLLGYDRLFVALRLRIIFGSMHRQSSLVIVYIRSFLLWIRVWLDQEMMLIKMICKPNRLD